MRLVKTKRCKDKVLSDFCNEMKWVWHKLISNVAYFIKCEMLVSVK